MTKKIYTKTGDKGETGTIVGRMSKSDQLAVAIGSIDELNSWIGLCRSHTKLEDELRKIQNNLFVIGSTMAGSKRRKFKASETKRLEKFIDKLTLQLPKLDNFVYPVGYLQVARSVARRAEREVVALEIKKNISSMKNILKYLNRLSDALFVMARRVNLQLKIKEEVWRGK